MVEIKTKRSVSRRVRKDAGSPEPAGPTGGMPTNDPMCGHSGCGRMCNVRYVGPTSHVNDHHIIHTARGVANVWSAAIVAGLAVVLTGAIAYSSVEAASRSSSREGASSLTGEMKQMNQRLERIETVLRESEPAKLPIKRPSVPAVPVSCIDRCTQSVAALFPAASPKIMHQHLEQCVLEHCDAADAVKVRESIPAETKTPSEVSEMSCIEQCANQLSACQQQGSRDLEDTSECEKVNSECEASCQN